MDLDEIFLGRFLGEKQAQVHFRLHILEFSHPEISPERLKLETLSFVQ